MKSRIAFSLTLLLSSPLSLANNESFGIIGGSVTYGESVFSVKDTPQLGATPNLFYSGPIGFIDGSLANWQALPYVAYRPIGVLQKSPIPLPICQMASTTEMVMVSLVLP